MSEQARVGIKSFGAYIPRRRMSRAAIAAAHSWALPSLKGLGKGEKSFCNWDEDVITMAVEAARDTLRGFAIEDVENLDLASTTAPYADNQNATIVASALNASHALRCSDMGGSLRAGLTSLVRACESNSKKDHLVVASEQRRAKPGSQQEMTYGSGASALLLGVGDDVVADVVAAESSALAFPDHFRKANQKYDYSWEERWVRDEGVFKIVPETVARLLVSANVSAEDVKHFGFSGGPAGMDKRVVAKLGFAKESLLPNFQGDAGDMGTAQSIMQLVAALETASIGDLIVIVSFASGCEAVLVKVVGEPKATERKAVSGTLANGLSESAYLKMLSHDGEIQLDWGMRAESDSKTQLASYYRRADEILGFSGGKCSECGATQFPILPLCVECESPKPLALVPLADCAAKIATHTTDWLMYTPAPPLYVGLVQFDVGARIMMEIVDVGDKQLNVDMPLEMVFRIKERDAKRHIDRYFWKASPKV